MAVNIKIINASSSLNKKWRIDGDGMLRITMRLVKEGVYEYLESELPVQTTGKNKSVPVALFRDAFQNEFLTSIEGKPVIVDSHEWRTADNTNRDGLTVGAIAGKPRVVGNSIEVDAIITDRTAVNAIMSGALSEVSAAYNAEYKEESGELSGVPYRGKQQNLEFNHVLLLPSNRGRMGNDVCILNAKPRDKSMSITLKRRFGNSGPEKVYSFTNEDDAREAERMCNESDEEKEKEREKEKEEVKNECAKLKNERDEALQKVSELEGRVAELSSAEHAESLARLVTAQDADEQAVLESALQNETLDTVSAEKVRTELKNCKTMQERRVHLVHSIFAAQGVEDLTRFDNAALDGAFEALALNARMTTKRMQAMNARRTPNAQPMQQHVSNAGPVNPADRVFRSMGNPNGNKGE